MGQSMLGFEIGFWDFVTFASVLVILIAVTAVAILIMGLPGRIAIARKHPEAEAVNIMGWAGFLAVVPWIQAFIWAFKPTDVVDIRRFPREERAATEQEIARLSGTASPGETKTPHDVKPDAHKDA